MEDHWRKRNAETLGWWRTILAIGFDEEAEAKIVAEEKRKADKKHGITHPILPPIWNPSGQDNGPQAGGFSPGFMSTLFPDARAGASMVGEGKYSYGNWQKAVENINSKIGTVASGDMRTYTAESRAIPGIPQALVKKMDMARNPHIAELVRFFRQKGLSDQAAAGVVTNLVQESFANPHDREGLPHWTGSRLTAARKYFHKGKEEGLRNVPLDAQAQYIWDEMNPGLRRKLLNAPSAGQAAYDFGKEFEIPHKWSDHREADVLGRGLAAENFYQDNKVQIEILHKNVPEGTQLKIETQGKGAKVTGIRQEKAMAPINSTVGN